MKSIIAAVASLGLVGCQSSTTNSYVYIGDAAFKSAAVPAAMKAGLKAEAPGTGSAAQPGAQGGQDLGGQTATNGTNIIIGVNSTTAKPVIVDTTATVTVPQESMLKKGVRVAGAATGAAITGNPAGAAAGALLPEAAEAVKSVSSEAINAVSGK